VNNKDGSVYYEIEAGPWVIRVSLNGNQKNLRGDGMALWFVKPRMNGGRDTLVPPTGPNQLDRPRDQAPPRCRASTPSTEGRSFMRPRHSSIPILLLLMLLSPSRGLTAEPGLSTAQIYEHTLKATAFVIRSAS
jgi:hypothetical protein